MAKDSDFNGLLSNSEKIHRTEKTLTQCRAVWEAAYGTIPEGFEIHHINRNPDDNKLENLACLDKRYHEKMHANDPSNRGKQNPVTTSERPAIKDMKDEKRLWITVREAGELIGFSRISAHYHIRMGRLEARKVGNMFMVTKKSAEKLKEIRENGSYPIYD